MLDNNCINLIIKNDDIIITLIRYLILENSISHWGTGII